MAGQVPNSQRRVLAAGDRDWNAVEVSTGQHDFRQARQITPSEQTRPPIIGWVGYSRFDRAVFVRGDY
jgi:hypothetical protein